METTKRHRIISIIVIFLLVVNLAGLGTLLYHKVCRPKEHKECMGKGCKHGPQGDDHSCFNEFIKKDLNLNKKQETDFLKIKTDFYDLAKKYMDSIEMQKAAIFDEMAKEKPDNKVLESNTIKSAQLFTTLKKKTIEHFLSIKAIFTPEQQAKYFKFIKEKSCCNMEGMGPKGEGCMGGNHDKCKKQSDSKCPQDKEMNCPEHPEKPCCKKK